MGFLQEIIDENLFFIVYTELKDHVSSTCRGSFDKRHICELETWLKTDLIGWLNQITFSIENSPTLCTERLLFYLYDSYVRLR